VRTAHIGPPVLSKTLKGCSQKGGGADGQSTQEVRDLAVLSLGFQLRAAWARLSHEACPTSSSFVIPVVAIILTAILLPQSH